MGWLIRGGVFATAASAAALNTPGDNLVVKSAVALCVGATATVAAEICQRFGTAATNLKSVIAEQRSYIEYGVGITPVDEKILARQLAILGFTAAAALGSYKVTKPLLLNVAHTVAPAVQPK